MHAKFVELKVLPLVLQFGEGGVLTRMPNLPLDRDSKLRDPSPMAPVLLYTVTLILSNKKNNLYSAVVVSNPRCCSYHHDDNMHLKDVEKSNLRTSGTKGKLI
ncbi:hypothetical protein TNCV_4292681 [Trichonephila clavipes]|uniref:Uncharacterized protein n=1 Tax=Trichonephila clavipes TaxID=2585209 RepID=A0A8X6RFU6_TRICX|nr:hypothetical protein TNCV_4292681 [Trichonephila clavipes]